MTAWLGTVSSWLWASPRDRSTSRGGKHSAYPAQSAANDLAPLAELADPLADRRQSESVVIEGHSQPDVLAQLRAGNSDALAAIYRTYAKVLLLFGLTLTRSRETTEELIHDLFLILWERRASLDIHEDLGIYLRTALRNRAYKVARHNKTVRHLEDYITAEHQALPAIGSITAPDTELEAAEVERAFAAALAAINDRDRQILTMRWRDELTHDEIARILGISRTRVRTIIARHQERLRPFFEQLRDDA